ncbi:hypothetical protein U1701_12195 [Sphingomonas sp. PB2P19]|uniref:hypothetical protein n=1 Tax=Sphingomonas rhamnosi TaxID=3096156 RepID=UPI002FCBA9F7
MHPRCPICGNADWLDRAWPECSHCRLIVRDFSDLFGVAGEVRTRLASGTVDLAGDPPEGWRLDGAGLRNAAWRFGHAVSPGLVPDGRPAVATTALAASVPHDVGLAVMARPADVDDVVDLATTLRGPFARITILIDGTPDDLAPIVARVPWVSGHAHPLEGDFAAQRNRLQDLAGTRWVLQLDADERPDAALLAALGWLVEGADRDGLRALGLPRRNIVDGAQSALYPDIQYRLTRGDIRFEGRVHERPVVPFPQSSLALAGTILHRLDGERVRARTRIYEGMSAGAGRPEDETRLLEPFDPIAVR